MVQICGLGSVHCTAFIGIFLSVGVAHEINSKNPGRNAIMALVFIIKSPGRATSEEFFSGVKFRPVDEDR